MARISMTTPITEAYVSHTMQVRVLMKETNNENDTENMKMIRDAIQDYTKRCNTSQSNNIEMIIKQRAEGRLKIF